MAASNGYRAKRPWYCHDCVEYHDDSEPCPRRSKMRPAKSRDARKQSDRTRSEASGGHDKKR